MLYDVTRILEVLTQPGMLLVAILALGVLFFVLGLRRFGGGVVIAATVLLVAASILPVGKWAAAPLERRFPEPQLPAKIDGIILLGGAVNIGATLVHGKVSINPTAGRLTDTLILAHRYPDVPVVISGGDPSIEPLGLAEADATRTLFTEIGLDPHRIVVENRSRNTYENAVFTKELVNPKPGQVWVLVTSAMDIPRAIGCFRHVGWDVLPYPADYHVIPGAWLSPTLEGNLGQLNWALHEWEGLVAYRL
ncbi:MAG TPA: YdcF family protein, partial [Stellaceae bacterium]|nr:YdcF family protein [Stellaceae bacterium]